MPPIGQLVPFRWEFVTQLRTRGNLKVGGLILSQANSGNEPPSDREYLERELASARAVLKASAANLVHGVVGKEAAFAHRGALEVAYQLSMIREELGWIRSLLSGNRPA
jgi:hypothetical protein